jgi:hypothetical protein
MKKKLKLSRRDADTLTESFTETLIHRERPENPPTFRLGGRQKEMPMEINTTNPVSTQVQGLEAAQKAPQVKREDEEAAGRQTQQTEPENPDYRISLSDESKQAIAELTSGQPAVQGSSNGDLTEDEALQLSQQASEQLAQTNAAISNQAIQSAVDLFT